MIALARILPSLLAATASSPESGRPPGWPRPVAMEWRRPSVTALARDRALVSLVATKHFGYRPCDDSDLERLRIDLDELFAADGGGDDGSSAASSSRSVDQALCVRNLLYQVRLEKSRGELDPCDVARSYAEERSVSWTSERLSIPPLEVVKAVVRFEHRLKPLAARRVVERCVDFVKADPSAASRLDRFALEIARDLAGRRSRLPDKSKSDVRRFARSLDESDWREMVWACCHDLRGLPKDRVRDEADMSERLLVEYLRGEGVTFRTEEDLRREKRPLAEDATKGGKFSTPDVVVVDGPCKIALSGREANLRWFDVKNMYGTVSCGPASRALYEQLASKAERYVSDWGPGAFVFRHGYCEALEDRLGRVLRGSGRFDPSLAESVFLLDGSGLGMGRS